MTLTIISTQVIAAGTAHTYAADGDELIILSGATLASTVSQTLGGLNLANLSLSVQGTLVSPTRLLF